MISGIEISNNRFADLKNMIQSRGNHMINGIEDLYAYLEEIGEPFHPEWAGGHDETVQREFNAFLRSGKTAADFYRESKILMYHLAWFGEDQWKQPYHRIIRENFVPPATLLDYGCGIASDGLKFAESGYPVKFMDNESECTKFAEWRLRKYSLGDVAVHAFNEPLDKVKLVFAFDVIEHTPNPKELLSQIEQRGEYVAVNLLAWVGEPVDGKEHLHYHHDPQETTDWIKGHSEVLQERDFNYARFIIYKPNEQIVLPKRARKSAIITLDNSSNEEV